VNYKINNYMKKLIKIVGLALAGLMTWFSPVQMANSGICCVACAMKKEEEVKIEYVKEEDTKE
jgi:esterase/lipase